MRGFNAYMNAFVHGDSGTGGIFRIKFVVSIDGVKYGPGLFACVNDDLGLKA